VTVDWAVTPGLLLLLAQVVALAAVGYVVARTVLRQDDERLALAQGLVVGLALWGFVVNVVLYVIPAPAGAIASWVLTLTLGVGLAWRARRPLRPSLRTTAGVLVAALALFWVALASRQLLSIVEDFLHLGLAASIRAGGFHPPAFPWSPDLPSAYHYGANLLVALMTPPFGPDLAFVTELLGAYLWMSFALIVGLLLLQRGSWIAVLALAPLLLTAGAWTQLHYITPPGIVQIPAVGEVPAPVRAAWVGFLGLAAETVALMVLVLWALLEAAQFAAARPPGGQRMRETLRAVAGPAIAALVLGVGGGAITGVLTGPSGSGLSLAWIDDPASRRPIGAFIDMSGGLGLLALGVVPVAVVAVLLAWRDRLVLALALGSGIFLLAALTLQYEFSRDVARLDGHARNFALLGLIAALGLRLPALRPRRRYVAGALLIALVTWPTVVTPLRNLGPAFSAGVELANAEPGRREFDSDFLGREVLRHSIPDGVVAYIRDHTPADARILSPNPSAMSIATGRANASGFADFIQFSGVRGPEYVDAIRRLEPAAIRRLGFDYLHATDGWLDSLPPRATEWIQDPSFFELLVRGGAEALYRIRPEFLEIDAAPLPESFEALRQAVPASATVFLSPSIDHFGSVRAASVLSHAHLLGAVRVFAEHLRPGFHTEPLGDRTPDLVVTSARLAPSAFPPGQRTPIWSNDDFAVYAPGGAVAPITRPAAPLLSVRVSSVSTDDGRLAFTATLADDAAKRWSGQDWLVVAADDSPWAFPRDFNNDGRLHRSAQWFGGQFYPGQGIVSHAYLLDAHTGSLAVQGRDGRFVPAPASESGVGPGVWTLALRLRHDWWEAAFIPIARIEIAEDGTVIFKVYEEALSVTPIPSVSPGPRSSRRPPSLKYPQPAGSQAGCRREHDSCRPDWLRRLDAQRLSPGAPAGWPRHGYGGGGAQRRDARPRPCRAWVGDHRVCFGV